MTITTQTAFVDKVIQNGYDNYVTNECEKANSNFNNISNARE